MSGGAWPAPVEELLAADQRIGSVPADKEFATQILDDVCEQECTLAMFAATREQWSKVNTLTYDAARKAVEALLLSHGWRVLAVPGAHAVVGDIVERWLGADPDPGPRIAAKFAASRKARHDDEYPHPAARQRTTRELRAYAQDNVRLVNVVREQLGLPPRPDLIASAENLEMFLGDLP